MKDGIPNWVVIMPFTRPMFIPRTTVTRTASQGLTDHFAMRNARQNHHESVDGADRKIDLTGNEQECHTGGNDRQDRDLSGYQ